MKSAQRLSVVALAATGLAAPVLPAFAQLSGPGDIAFTGFNGDGVDNLAFATFVNIPAGTVINFTDNEWTGAGWSDTNENAWSWTAGAPIAAGTIITLDNVGGVQAGTATSNLGAVAPIAGAGTNAGISNDGDAIFAFFGDYAAPAGFLSVIGNNAMASTATTLANTGLVENETAFFLAGGLDVMAYSGLRDNQLTFAAYRSQVYGLGASWATQNGGGDQSLDGVFPDVPFVGAPFTIPAPSAAALFAFAGAIAGRRRR